MTINYRNLNAEIELVLFMSDKIKRKFEKVEIPAYQNFKISDMRDESFNKMEGLWYLENGKWKLNTSKLSSSEKYLLTLKGMVPKDTLSKIVFVQPSANRDQTEEFDRYWLSSMIKNVDILEKIWDSVNVDDVTANINIGIERCFSTTIPKDLKERVNATRRWLQAGHHRDREEVVRAWSELHRAEGKFSISIDDLMKMIHSLTSDNTFLKYLSIDEPYTLGEIRRQETYKGSFPEKMYTEASTFLNLKQPAAKGYLCFNKKDYTEKIENEFEKLI